MFKHFLILVNLKSLLGYIYKTEWQSWGVGDFIKLLSPVSGKRIFGDSIAHLDNHTFCSVIEVNRVSLDNQTFCSDIEVICSNIEVQKCSVIKVIRLSR